MSISDSKPVTLHRRRTAGLLYAITILLSVVSVVSDHTVPDRTPSGDARTSAAVIALVISVVPLVAGIVLPIVWWGTAAVRTFFGLFAGFLAAVGLGVAVPSLHAALTQAGAPVHVADISLAIAIGLLAAVLLIREWTLKIVIAPDGLTLRSRFPFLRTVFLEWDRIQRIKASLRVIHTRSTITDLVQITTGRTPPGDEEHLLLLRGDSGTIRLDTRRYRGSEKWVVPILNRCRGATVIQM